MDNRPRLVIAGTHSGSGKTTLSIALMAALKNKGYRVQPYKTGPDYIDPGYHTAATGRVSRNLDSFMLGEQGVRELFYRSSADADISIIEGVMGMYDGLGSSDRGSTAHISKILRAPVILVLDARSMARSAAATVLGYKSLDPGVELAGVILNRVGSSRHYSILTESIEGLTGVPVLGHVPRRTGLSMPERHLGLVPTSEKDGLFSYLSTLAEQVTEGINLEDIVQRARLAGPFPAPETVVFSGGGTRGRARIAVVRDEAFTFYYQDGLELLEAMGAELVYCSALGDSLLPPDIDGIYIGGGFPEMFLEQLSLNTGFREGIKGAWQEGMPIYAECGGLMYLTRSITDFAGAEYPMAGIIPGRCVMREKRAALGYVTARVLSDNIIAAAGTTLKGHEFHYSTLEMDEGYDTAYIISKDRDEGRREGYIRGNLLASYLHLHFAGCPGAARRFVETCAAYRGKRLS